MASAYACKKRKRGLGLRLSVFGVGLALVALFYSNIEQNQPLKYSLREKSKVQHEEVKQVSINSINSRVLSGGGSGQWLPDNENDQFYEVCGQNSSFCVDSPNGCSYPKEYPFTCCNDEDLCLTAEHEEECRYNKLCVAELVPGGSGAAECLKPWETAGGVALYIFLLLYCFVGLAIVCDDYFVPSLEKISEGLSLSEDVAGATFMAAGSSAPELFVSLADNVISNPPKSVGIGTIVGSAIFNILVIIGLSALMAGQALALNWRPFVRDAGFYTISVIFLIIVVNDGIIRWWEGLVLLSIYFLYVVFMMYNEKIFSWLDRKMGLDRKIDEADDIQARVDGVEETSAGAIAGENGSTVSSKTDSEMGENGNSRTIPESAPSELMLTDQNNNLVDAARVVVAADADESPNEPSSFGNNSSGRQYHTVETSRPTKAVEAAAEAMKINKKHGSESNLLRSMSRQYSNGSVSKVASSKNPLHMSKYRGGWNQLRREGSQTIKLKDVAHAVLRANTASKIWMQTAQEGQRRRMIAENDGGMNMIDENGGSPATAQNLAQEEVEVPGPYWECLMWPMQSDESDVCERGEETPKKALRKRTLVSRACGDWKTLWGARLWYIISLPLNICFRLTIPDCNYDIFREDKEGEDENRKIGYSLTFIGCIVWIAILSHFLVFFAAKFGCIVGISPAVMGLTILAAGTSVPDALSSVLVARNGQGDMAVANSIGSNVFDILIGLGLPWMLAGLIYNTDSIVGVDDLWIGIGFLFGVLICLIVALLAANWILRRGVGVVLLALYLLYVVFELFIHPLIK